ncbi:MAG: sugar nucleotide-binding protein, partial [Deltaproteobacteria bacterium]|nr:sugar nucleotide-binding protein [Deltaproteobacteria bacterium]
SRPLPAPRPARPILVTGSGALAREIFQACRLRGLSVVAPGRSLDVRDADAVSLALEELAPWAVFNAAGVRDGRSAERDPAGTARLHTDAPSVLALECELRRIRLATLSSSLVLPSGGAHDETVPRAPRTVLGAAQAEGEQRILERYPGALVLRCGFVVGLGRTDDFLAAGLALLRDRGQWSVPAYASVIVAGLLAQAGLDLLEDGETGIWHLAHRRPLLELARTAARHAGLDVAGVVAETTCGARLVSIRGQILPSCGPALRALVRAGVEAPAPAS